MINYNTNKNIKNRKSNFSFLFIVLFAWSFFILFFHNGLRLITTEAIAVTQPAQERTGVVIQFLGDIFNFTKIRNDYYRLKEKEKNFEQNLGKINTLKTENESLHKILNSDLNKFNILPAKVLVGDINGTDGIFIINRGLNDDIKVNMNVIIPENVLVGRVIEVFKNYSKVESIHSINTNLSVLSLENNFLALLKKDNNGSLGLKFYSDNSVFKNDDIFITSSENKNYIAGLLVGKIKSVKNTALTNQKNVLIDLFFEPSKLRNVFVITNYP